MAAALCSGGALAALPPFDDRTAWREIGVRNKPATRFETVRLDDDAPALRVVAERSYGNLVHALPAGTVARGSLQWQWRLDERNDAADLTRRTGDDVALKVCALYDLPIERVPIVERTLLRFARAWSGEPLPAAAVCYVWDARLAPGTALDNRYSRRVRYLVLRGPEAPLAQWAGERRELAADFRRLFGDESPDALPPLAAIAVGADADDTGARSAGQVRALELRP